LAVLRNIKKTRIVMDMTQQHQVYKCALCGQVIEVLHAGSPSLVCCGQPMKHLVEGATDGAKEKHVPVLEKTAAGCKVKVGSVAHPMLEEHYIEWIEIITKNGKQVKQFLKPGQAPEADFLTPFEDVAGVREYCNLHGVWKA